MQISSRCLELGGCTIVTLALLDRSCAAMLEFEATIEFSEGTPVLHRVQMTPAPFPGVVPGAGPVTIRAAELRARAAIHEDPHLLVGMGNLDPRDLPGPLQADQLRVVLSDRRVGHPGSISPFPGRPPRVKRQTTPSALYRPS